MSNKGQSLLSRALALFIAFSLIAMSLSCLSAVADTPDRLNDANLEAYYNFEDATQPGRDASDNNRHLRNVWGYPPTALDSQSGDLNLGTAVKFGGISSLSSSELTFGERDILDDLETYTLSMFYQNTADCTGGMLFNNKYWGEDGVQVTVNKWSDPAATGQVEMYLDYNYLDTSGNTQTFHQCVKFIPEAASGVDTSWHHIALTVDKPNHTIRFYFDGELVHENSNMNELLVDCPEYPYAFGAMVDPQWPSSDRPYDGLLDEIRIYNFAADTAEVGTLARNFAKAPDRLNGENLEAYYDFEDGSQIGKDASGNNHHLRNVWGYPPTSFDSNSGELNLGAAASFAGQSSLSPADSAFDTRDFLDDMDTYTLSMFFQNTETCAGGMLFNNKFWNEDGVQVTVNKWSDPSASGQVEMYLDYNYLDASGNPQIYHECVKFIPETASGVDTSWHHIALTVDKPNHTIQLYFDGALVHENSNMNALLADSQKYPVAFGAMVDPQWPSSDRPYDGSLDEIRIYDFVATAEEVSRLSTNDVAPESPEDDWQIDRVPTMDAYDLYTYTLPYWEGDTVYQEQLLVLKGADGSVPIKSLMYPATEILSVRSHDLETVYAEGTDYILQDGKLVFPEGSTIPMMEYDTYYPATHTEGKTFGKTGGGYIMYTEEFQKQQISVTYKHSGSWNGTIPSYQGGYIPKTIEKLENKEPLKIVFYGDSITEGYSASGYHLYAPYTETWATMVTKMLRANYEYSDITMVNSALAGTDTAWGVDDANLTPRVIEQDPDLVVIAFGMNDGNRSLEDYRNKIQGMITKVRATNPDTEFLLVSSMLPNREVDWLATGNQGSYQDELVALQAANEGVGVARVTDAFRTLIENKDYYDASGNNVNHPNDFTVRLYAQTVLAALDGNIDTSALIDLIAKAEALDQGRYTPESWANLAAALQHAKGLVNSQDQTLIDQEVKALKAAIDALETVDRLTSDHLLGYYNFEDKDDIGKDLSKNGNHLDHGFWGDVITLAPSGNPLGGSSARFLGASVLTLKTRAANQKDFLDLEDAYTVSFFFKMANGSKGGALFSNKNWADEGVKLTAHTWEDPTAVGQVEIYLDYAYRDQTGNLKNFHQVVYFMPEAAGGGIDMTWHHIALVVDKEKGVRFFFDGEEKNVSPGETVSEYALDCEKYTMAFGASYDDDYANAQEPFNGWLDEVRIYDFAVDESEARLLKANENLDTPEAPEPDPPAESNRLTLTGATESGLNVRFEIARDAVPEGVSLQVNDTNTETKEKLLSVYGDVISLDVALLDSGEILTDLQDYANLVISGVNDWSGYRLYRLTPDGALEAVDYYVDDNGHANIYTRGLGTLAFVKEKGGQTGDGADSVPQMGDSSAVASWMLLLGFSLLAVVMCLRKSHFDGRKTK